ncbi:MAG: DUF86 domain-containing protein [Deltaproteobacteria bacterium]|nr:DUF86 domain-containing protein [Deltaproteobacteria bacterium]
MVLKKLAFIETCLTELRTLARPAELLRDVRERRFVEHTLQLAIQAALDVAAHIVAEGRLGEPATNRELFDLLAAHAWIDPALRDDLRRMAGFRNVLVHGYAAVDPTLVRDVVDNHLGDLERFVTAVRGRLVPPPAAR